MSRRLPLSMCLVAVFCTGCAGGGTPKPPPFSMSAPPAAESSPVPEVLRVTNAAGRPLLAIVTRPGRTSISSRLGGSTVRLAGRDGRYVRSGRLVVVVRTDRRGVTLTSGKGRMLWRATVSGARVRIQRGGSGARYDVRRGTDGGLTVRQGVAVVGSVRPTEQGSRVDYANGAPLGRSSSPPGTELAVLLCAQVPPDLRAPLAAAFLSRR